MEEKPVSLFKVQDEGICVSLHDKNEKERKREGRQKFGQLCICDRQTCSTKVDALAHTVTFVCFFGAKCILFSLFCQIPFQQK